MSYAVASSEPSQAKPRGRGTVIAGIVLLVASVAFGILGAVLIVVPKDGLVDLFRQQPHTTPVTIDRHFDKGIFFVWQDLTDPAQIPIADVSVSDANGIAVRVYESAADETLTLGSVEYANVAAFKITSPGTYRVNVATTDSHVIIGPSLATAGKKAIPGGIAIGLAGLMFVVGLALLIVGLVTVNRSKRPTVAPTLTVPPAQGVWPLGPGYAPVDLNQNFPPPMAQPPQTQPAQTQPPQTQPAQIQPTVAYPSATQPQAVQPAAVDPTLVLPFGAEPTATQPPVAPPVAPPPPVAPVIPAGWYPDSERPGGRRYWDGTAWTEHRA